MDERVSQRNWWAVTGDIGFSVFAASLGLALLLATGRHLLFYAGSDGLPVVLETVRESARTVTAVAAPAPRRAFVAPAARAVPRTVRALAPAGRVRAPVIASRQAARPVRPVRSKAATASHHRSPAGPGTRPPAAHPRIRPSAAQPFARRTAAAQPLVRRTAAAQPLARRTAAAQPLARRTAAAQSLVQRPGVVPRPAARIARTRPQRRRTIVAPPQGYDPVPSLVAIPATAPLDPAGLEPLPQVRIGRRH